MITFKEKTTFVFENFRFNKHYTGQLRTLNFHNYSILFVVIPDIFSSILPKGSTAHLLIDNRTIILNLLRRSEVTRIKDIGVPLLAARKQQSGLRGRQHLPGNCTG